MENSKYFNGYIYNKDGKYVHIYLENNVENVANFVAKTPFSGKVMITNALDLTVLSTIGNYLDRIDSPKYRNELLKYLVPLQSGDSECKSISFLWEDNQRLSKEEFIKFVFDNTEYNLV